MTRYDFPEPFPKPSSPYVTHVSTDPDAYLHDFQFSGALAHLPPYQYRITLPSTPIGPKSLLPVVLALRLPAPADSPPLALHSVSVVLERRMDLYRDCTQGPPGVLSGTTTTTPEAPPTPSRTSRASAAVLPAKSLRTTIATAESTLGGSAGSSSSSSSADLTINLDVPPRWPGEWPMGETTRTDLASIAFYVRVKVGVVVQSQSQSQSPPRPQSPHHATSLSSGAAPTVYEYELPEREVQMVCVSEEERAVAMARIAEHRSRSRTNPGQASTGAADAKSMLTADALVHSRASWKAQKPNDLMAKYRSHDADVKTTPSKIYPPQGGDIKARTGGFFHRCTSRAYLDL